MRTVEKGRTISTEVLGLSTQSLKARRHKQAIHVAVKEIEDKEMKLNVLIRNAGLSLPFALWPTTPQIVMPPSLFDSKPFEEWQALSITTFLQAGVKEKFKKELSMVSSSAGSLNLSMNRSACLQFLNFVPLDWSISSAIIALLRQLQSCARQAHLSELYCEPLGKNYQGAGCQVQSNQHLLERRMECQSLKGGATSRHLRHKAQYYAVVCLQKTCISILRGAEHLLVWHSPPILEDHFIDRAEWTTFSHPPPWLPLPFPHTMKLLLISNSKLLNLQRRWAARNRIAMLPYPSRWERIPLIISLDYLLNFL